jgi:plastocyanin
VAALFLLAAIGPIGASAASTVTIRIGSTLSPAVVTVAPGTRLVWVNRDGERHRVRTTSGPAEFDSGNLEPGETWSVTVSANGTYAYVDDRDRDNVAYHGRIVVSASAPGTAGGSGGSGGSGGGAGAQSGGTTPAPPARASVTIRDGSFGPASVTIAAGGSVTFRNGDDREHTATGRGAGFDTGALAPGAASTKRFSAAGTFAYLCAIHPDMQGTVRVVAAGRAAPPPPPAAPKPTPIPSAPATVDGLTPPAGGSASDSTRSLQIVDLAFDPASASVIAGTTVTWTNGGIAPHTVTAVDGAFDSGMLNAGATWTRRFDQAGTFRFACAVHPDMAGVLTVTARTSSVVSPSATAPPDAVAPAAVTVAPSQPSPRDTASVSNVAPATAIDGGGLPRAAITLLVCLVAVAFFGRLIRGTARR